jgi:hypothetical protein
MASCTVALPKGARDGGHVGIGAIDVAVDDTQFVHGQSPFFFNAASSRG